MGHGTLREVRDELGDPRRGPGWVGGTSERSRTGRGPPGDAGWVGGPSGRSGTGRVTLQRVKEPSERSGQGRGTLGEVQDWERAPRGGPR